MSDKVLHRHDKTGKTLYLIVVLGDKVWDDTVPVKALVPIVSADWANYAVAMVEQDAPNDTRQYVGTFPSVIPDDEYGIQVFEQKGVSPAPSDDLAGTVEGAQWDDGELLTLQPSVPRLRKALANIQARGQKTRN